MDEKPADIPKDAATALAQFLEALDFGFELAVAGTQAREGVDREEAIRRVGRTFAEEDREHLAAPKRMLEIDDNNG
ncbi:MAG: hypothetical protein AB1486_01040 [Planctomycetota bacterium]